VGTRRSLAVRPARVAGLRAGRFRGLLPRGRASAVRALLGAELPVRVGPLLASRRTVRGGRPLTVAAAQLPGEEAVLTVTGPAGYARETPLRIQGRLAAARLRLPRRPGRYTLAIADLSPLAATGTAGRLAATHVTVTR
jgi:hypothetical protein